MPAHSRQLRVPGGAPGSPSLAGVEGGSKARTLGESQAHRDFRQARFPICSAGTVRSPLCDEASGHGEQALKDDNNGSPARYVQYSPAVYLIAHAFFFPFFKQMRDYGSEKEEVKIS